MPTARSNPVVGKGASRWRRSAAAQMVFRRRQLRCRQRRVGQGLLADKTMAQRPILPARCPGKRRDTFPFAAWHAMRMATGRCRGDISTAKSTAASANCALTCRDGVAWRRRSLDADRRRARWDFALHDDETSATSPSLDGVT
jgi:hypothetical protein